MEIKVTAKENVQVGEYEYQHSQLELGITYNGPHPGSATRRLQRICRALVKADLGLECPYGTHELDQDTRWLWGRRWADFMSAGQHAMGHERRSYSSDAEDHRRRYFKIRVESNHDDY